MHPLGLGLAGHDLQAQLLGLALQALDGPLAGSFFVMPLARVTILGLVLEHSVDDAGQLVGGGGDGGRGIGAGFYAAEKGTEIRIAVGEGSGGESKGLGSAILRLLGAGFDDLATGDVIVGTDREPRGKELDRFPLGHIEADFGEDGLDG